MEAKRNRLKEKYNEIIGFYRANEVVTVNEQLQELLAMAKEEGNHYYYALGLNFLGALQIAIGNPSRAIDFYFEAMLYAEKHRVRGILALVYNNIAARYLDAEDFETGLYYMKKVETYKDEEPENEPVREDVHRQRIITFDTHFALAYTNQSGAISYQRPGFRTDRQVVRSTARS